jgi:hypothetical protein
VVEPEPGLPDEFFLRSQFDFAKSSAFQRLLHLEDGDAVALLLGQATRLYAAAEAGAYL